MPVIARTLERRQFSPRFGARVTVNRTSLQMSNDLAFADWRRLGEQLAGVGDSLAWWVGDWIEQGSAVYGAKYKSALEVLPLAESTLQNYAYVARCFSESSRRRELLSFGHHAEVASLLDADEWLDRALNESWSRNRLRAEVQQARVPELAAAPSATVRVEIRNQVVMTFWLPADVMAGLRSKARAQKLPVEKFAMNLLDEAAERDFGVRFTTRSRA